MLLAAGVAEPRSRLVSALESPQEIMVRRGGRERPVGLVSLPAADGRVLHLLHPLRSDADRQARQVELQSLIAHDHEHPAPRNRIAKVTSPVMLVHGDADNVIPISDSIELHRRLPGSELVVVPGGTHADLDPFRPFFDAVDRFLRRHLHTPISPKS